MSRTMTAMQMIDYNKPLEIKEVSVPEVHGEEVLVRIQASGLCHSDLHLIHGSPKVIRGFPHILGHENAGTVVVLTHSSFEGKST
jgi:alcohol dehydrogenase, propanol-preferring